MGFVAASTGPEGGNRLPPKQSEDAAAAVRNADEVDLDEDL